MNNVHFAIPEIYGETLSYYELLRKLVNKTNELIDNYNTVPDQIDEAVKNLDASQLFSAVLNQIIDSIATDNTKSTNAVKVYKKHDLLYATFNETVNLYESLIDFTTGTETELIVGTNIREVNISELFIELRKVIDNEAQAREQADTALQQNINTEKSARELGDTTLQQNINAEKSARELGDTTLQQNINAEKSARELGDTTLQSKINNGTLKVDTLWTNASVTSDFARQNIPIDLSNYKFVYISMNESTLNTKNVINELLINIVGKYDTSLYFLKSNITYMRGFTIGENGIYISEERSNGYEGVIENDHLIPSHIYGIK